MSNARTARRAGSDRFRPAVLATVLVAACLTPTDGGGRFGEARVKPIFETGAEPESLDIDIDSIRTTIRRNGSADPPSVDTVMQYRGSGEHAWIIELRTVADEMDVTLELWQAGEMMYRGTRPITVVEGSIGRTELVGVTVEYAGPRRAARVDMMPSQAAFTVIGAFRQLEAAAYDADDQLLPERPFSWSSADPAVASVDANGVVIAAGVGVTSVSAVADGVTGSATITVDTALAQSSTITADPDSIAADEISTSSITVVVRDADGNAIGASAGIVLLEDPALGTLTPVTDHDDGTYTATLTAGTIADDVRITGTLNGSAIGDTAHVTFRPLDTASPGRSTIVADSSSLAADGESTSLVTVTMLDANGTPTGESGGTVLLDDPALGTLSPVTDHENGTYTATLTAGTIAGNVMITGTLNGTVIGDTARVEFRSLVDTASPDSSTIVADSSSLVADGESTSLVTVTMLDANGTPTGESGGTVLLDDPALGTLTPVIDHEDGTYTATLKAGTVAGNVVISGTLNGAVIADSAVVVFEPRLGSPGATTIEADSTSLVLGRDSWTMVTVTVRDETGNRVGASAGTVTLSTRRGRLSEVMDMGDGTYIARLDTRGVLNANPDQTTGHDTPPAVVTGTLNGVTIADSAVVQLRTPTSTGGDGMASQVTSTVEHEGEPRQWARRARPSLR